MGVDSGGSGNKHMGIPVETKVRQGTVIGVGFLLSNFLWQTI